MIIGKLPRPSARNLKATFSRIMKFALPWDTRLLRILDIQRRMICIAELPDEAEYLKLYVIFDWETDQTAWVLTDLVPVREFS